MSLLALQPVRAAIPTCTSALFTYPLSLGGVGTAEVTVGSDTACVLKDGKLSCWGKNSDGTYCFERRSLQSVAYWGQDATAPTPRGGEALLPEHGRGGSLNTLATPALVRMLEYCSPLFLVPAVCI